MPREIALENIRNIGIMAPLNNKYWLIQITSDNVQTLCWLLPYDGFLLSS